MVLEGCCHWGQTSLSDVVVVGVKSIVVGCCCRRGQKFFCWKVAAMRVRKQLDELGQL
jgi:hypothetical protein